MTIETFISNVIILGVEQQLMICIPRIFDMHKLEENDIRLLGEESTERKTDREKTERDLRKLENGLSMCEEWVDERRRYMPTPKMRNGRSDAARLVASDTLLNDSS